MPTARCSRQVRGLKNGQSWADNINPGCHTLAMPRPRKHTPPRAPPPPPPPPSAATISSGSCPVRPSSSRRVSPCPPMPSAAHSCLAGQRAAQRSAAERVGAAPTAKRVLEGLRPGLLDSALVQCTPFFSKLPAPPPQAARPLPQRSFLPLPSKSHVIPAGSRPLPPLRSSRRPPAAAPGRPAAAGTWLPASGVGCGALHFCCCMPNTGLSIAMVHWKGAQQGGLRCAEWRREGGMQALPALLLAARLCAPAGSEIACSYWQRGCVPAGLLLCDGEGLVVLAGFLGGEGR